MGDVDAPCVFSFVNRGATCFLNSVLSCLMAIHPFREIVFDNTPFLSALDADINNTHGVQLHLANSNDTNPKRITRVIVNARHTSNWIRRLLGGGYQCTHETLVHILDASPAVERMFTGITIDSVTTCNNCRRTLVLNEQTNMLYLPYCSDFQRAMSAGYDEEIIGEYACAPTGCSRCTDNATGDLTIYPYCVNCEYVPRAGNKRVQRRCPLHTCSHCVPGCYTDPSTNTARRRHVPNSITSQVLIVYFARHPSQVHQPIHNINRVISIGIETPQLYRLRAFSIAHAGHHNSVVDAAPPGVEVPNWHIVDDESIGSISDDRMQSMVQSAHILFYEHCVQ